MVVWPSTTSGKTLMYIIFEDNYMLCFIIHACVFFSVEHVTNTIHLKNRSAMPTCGLMLGSIPLGLSVVFKCQYLGVQLLQVRRQSWEK